MKPNDNPLQTTIAANAQAHPLRVVELQICDEIDAYNDTVASGNNELAQMIHLNIQGWKRRREYWLKVSQK
jgi:hypothetical protein